MTNTTETIDVSKRQRERFDALRERCATGHTPPPTDNIMLKSLLDEWEHSEDQRDG